MNFKSYFEGGGGGGNHIYVHTTVCLVLAHMHEGLWPAICVANDM